MSITHADVESFSAFARSKIDTHGAESMSELFDLFLLENPTADSEEEVHAAIVQGLADIEAGRGRPADEVMAELRRKHGLIAE